MKDLYKRANTFVHSASLFLQREGDPWLTEVQQGCEVLHLLACLLMIWLP